MATMMAMRSLRSWGRARWRILKGAMWVRFEARKAWIIGLCWLVVACLFQGLLSLPARAAERVDATTLATGATADASAIPASSDTQTLTLVVPFSARSGPDRAIRVIARVWSERAGHPVEVLNLVERQGDTAARWVASAAPDGRLVLLTTRALLDPPPPRARERAPKPLTPDDFTPLLRVGQLPFVTVLPAGTLGDRAIAELAEPRPGAVALQTLASWAPGIAKPLALPPPREEQPLPALPPRGDFLPEPVFGDLAGGDWNAVLAPPRLPPKLAARMRAELRDVMADPRVQLAIAQTGSELWEIQPDPTPPRTTPLPARTAAIR